MADLLGEVRSDSLRIDGENAMEKIGPRIQEAAYPRKVRAAAALDHVTGQRKRAAREPEQGNAAVQRTLDRGNRVEHIGKAREIGHGQTPDRRLVGQRPREARPLALDERKTQSHRVGNGENVGEKDRCIEREARERLQGDLGGQRGILAELHEASRARPGRVVLG